MKTFAAIIEAFRVESMAKVLKIPEQHVRVLRHRNSIPPEYWGQLIEAAPKYGITGLSWRRLKSMRDRRFAEPQREAS